MHYGIYVPCFGDYADARTLARLAREAEESGWDGFFMWDHMAMGWPDRVVDAWIALAAIAMNTERIRIGPLVTPLSRRRPWKVARETVSLDHLSNGRLIFGVGLGYDAAREFADFDEPVDPRTRAAILDEGLDVLTGLWRGGPFSYHGEYFKVSGALFLPPPLQSPRIPIWVAGYWPNKAPFRRAARWDGVFPLSPGGVLMSPEQIKEVLAYISTHRTAQAPFDVVHSGHTPGVDPARAAAIVAPYAAAGVTWWLEQVNPWRFGWDNAGKWPAVEMQARIRNGPPRV